MLERNLSPREMFIRMAAGHRPVHAFAHAGAKDPAGVAAWKSRAWPEVKATLGLFPDSVPANPLLLAEWRDRGLCKQKWIIDVAPHISASLAVNYPEVHAGAKSPAILCCHGHGHGRFGKDSVMGNGAGPEIKADIENMNYDYGRQMAEAGFVTFAIDWIGFGERNDSRKPNCRSGLADGRDWCNLYYLHATMFGMTSLSINIAHGLAAADFVRGFEEVDAGRMGVMGLSGGGTMALWLGLCDERFRATEVICYSDVWAAFGIRDFNYCGMQVAPGLYRLVDLPDLQGLMAPRPMLIDIGAYDACFPVDTAMACYRKAEKVYQAAGAADRLELDLFPGDHGWGGNKSIAFFTKHLG